MAAPLTLEYAIERLLAVADAYEHRARLELRYGGDFAKAAQFTSEARTLRDGARFLESLKRAAEAQPARSAGDVAEDGPTPVVAVVVEMEAEAE